MYILRSRDINWKCGKQKDSSVNNKKHLDLDKLAGCKNSTGLGGYNTTLMLRVDRAVIKFSTVQLIITRYTSVLSSKTACFPSGGADMCAEQRAQT